MRNADGLDTRGWPVGKATVFLECCLNSTLQYRLYPFKVTNKP